MRYRIAASVCVGVLTCSLSHVQASSAAGDDSSDVPPAGQRPVPELRKISVTATRTPREIDGIAGTVTVKTAEEIESELATDIRQLVRYEPGISVDNSAERFGLGGFNIRGVGGNRVLMRIDDVRMADGFSIGSFSDARRSLIDLDALKSVEIVRGAASALYGSDAIGGVVSFVTKDPMDYLQPGRALGGTARVGYAGNDDGWQAGGTVALGDERLSGLLNYTHREAGELDNQGSIASLDQTRTLPNPQQHESNSVLTKLVWNAGGGHAFKLTLDADRADAQANVLSSVGVTGTTNTQSLRSDDRQERSRASLSHEYTGAATLFDALRWSLHVQESEVTQRTLEQRFSVASGEAAAVLRDRRFCFDQTVFGGEVVLSKELLLAGGEHLFTYGIDAVQTDTEQMRDGVQTTLATGAQTKTILPDDFPVRDFPITRTRQLAAFVQDEISLQQGRWTLIPGVRLDAYQLDPRADAIFIEDNPGVATTGIDEVNVSPKLGAIRTLGDSLSLFAQYARGFRAPPYNDVNLGFTNLLFGYTSLPNPDLKSETSNSYELGLRGSAGQSYFAFSTFYNAYQDLIESQAFVGMQDGLVVFQSRNVSKARIYGAEWRSGLALDALTPALQSWRLNLSVAYARGEDQVADVPLNTVDPLTAVIGVAFDPADGRFGLDLIGTAVQRKSNVDDSTAESYIPPGYFTLDLLGHANISERLRLTAGIFNLTGKKYWDWSSVRGRAATSTVMDRYSQPGVNFSAAATYRF